MADMLHQGQITERNIDSASARVGFDDLSGSVSGLMQVLFPAVGGWNFYFTPKEGDQVVTARLPNGTEEGYILGKVYTANKMPQGVAKNIFLMVSDDGKNYIRFDADKGTIDIICDQGAVLKCKSLDIEVEKEINITAETADIEVKKSAAIKAETAKIKASKSATVESPDVKIDSAKATITGGELHTDGSVTPSGSGPYCGIPFCVANGAMQTGSKVTGT